MADAESGRERAWAMVPASVARQLVCSDCLRLYVLLDEEQREGGRPRRGVTPLADELGWQTRTVKHHLGHLADVGLIELWPPPEKGRGWSHVHFVVAHNPARGRYAATAERRGVWQSDPTKRWRSPSRLDDVLGQQHSVGGYAQGRPTSTSEQLATPGATRQVFERVAPDSMPPDASFSSATRQASDALRAALGVCSEPDCDALADGQPSPDGTPWCKPHENF